MKCIEARAGKVDSERLYACVGKVNIEMRNDAAFLLARA